MAISLVIYGRVYIGCNRDLSPLFAEVLAVTGDSIVFVGEAEEFKTKLVDSVDPLSTRVIHLQGDQILVPGFQDAHVHTLSGGISANNCSLRACKSKDEALQTIKQYASSPSNSSAEWIIGGGWQKMWFEVEYNGHPPAYLLDQLIPDRPAIFRRFDEHAAWCNTLALKRAGIYEPSGYKHENLIERDPVTKCATGTVHEQAMTLIYSKIPPLSLAGKLAGLIRGIENLYRNGITGFQEALVKVGNEEVFLSAYQNPEQVKQFAALPFASLCLFWENDKTEEENEAQLTHFVERRRCSNAKLQLNTVKIMLDGVIESRTAFLHEPYKLAADGTRGTANFTQEQLNAVITKLDKHQFHIHVHAIGDAAVTMALNAFEYAKSVNSTWESRHQIAHLQVVRPEDVPRFAKLGIIANFQPFWFVCDKEMVERTLPTLGSERYSSQYPIRDIIRGEITKEEEKEILEAGEKEGETGARKKKGKVCFGSDSPVSSINPIDGIHVAVNHYYPGISVSEHERDEAEGEDEREKEKHQDQDQDRYRVFLPNQRVSVGTALACYTSHSAHANLCDDQRGILCTGMRADAVVLSNNIFDMPSNKIYTTKVEKTIVDGKVVFEA